MSNGANVTVITPTIPGRELSLAEATACVRSQTLRPAPLHLVGVDRRRRGPARVRNQLLARARTEWVAFLDDDDLIDDDHLESLLTLAVTEEADVVTSWFRWPEPPGPFEAPRLDCFDADLLKVENFVPVTVLARRSQVQAAGGFDPHDRYEDWALWLRMLDLECKFAILPRITWTYRPTPKSRTQDAPVTWKQRFRYVRRHLAR